MPYTSELIKNGTISWPSPLKSVRHGFEYGRESVVLRGSAIFFGIYNPKDAVMFDYDPDWIDYVNTYLCENLENIGKEPLENFRVLGFSPIDENKRKYKRDFSATVSSMKEGEKRYKVTVGNIPRIKKSISPRNEVLTEFRSFLNYKGYCGCDSRTEKGEVCSMPENYFDYWYGHLYDSPLREYDRITNIDDDEPKVYGLLFCKHQVKTVVEDKRFPHMFNKSQFYSIFPEMINSIRDFPRKNKKLKIEELDMAVIPIIKKNMALGKISVYLKGRMTIDKDLKRLDEEILRATS